MAIVHRASLMASHELKTLLKSKISNSISLINSLMYLRENLHSWNIINSIVNEDYLDRIYDHHNIKSGHPSCPKKFEMEGLHNHQFEPRSKME
jgi:hypothetical protein